MAGLLGTPTGGPAGGYVERRWRDGMARGQGLLGDATSAAAYMVPGVGDVMDARDAWTAYQDAWNAAKAGQWGQAATSGVNALSSGLSALIPGLSAGGMAGAIKAYHGSPHDFDRFSLDKIGTGEGAQAFGHGLYFTDTPEVAESYRKDLSRNVLIDGEPFKPGWGVENEAHGAIQAFGLDGAIEHAKEWGKLDLLDWLTKNGSRVSQPTESARIYDVTLEHPPEVLAAGRAPLTGDDLLQWDKPLSEQPQAVRDFANERMRADLVVRTYPDGGLADVKYKGGNIGSFPLEKIDEVMRSPADFVPFKGYYAYRLAGQPQDATRAFLEAGIPGIRYLDGMSRADGTGTHNYVMFDDRYVNIDRKARSLKGLLGD